MGKQRTDTHVSSLGPAVPIDLLWEPRRGREAEEGFNSERVLREGLAEKVRRRR